MLLGGFAGGAPLCDMATLPGALGVETPPGGFRRG